MPKQFFGTPSILPPSPRPPEIQCLPGNCTKNDVSQNTEKDTTPGVRLILTARFFYVFFLYYLKKSTIDGNR
jgi:hypothetical protein